MCVAREGERRSGHNMNKGNFKEQAEFQMNLNMDNIWVVREMEHLESRERISQVVIAEM